MVVLVLKNQWRQASLKLARRFNLTVVHQPVEDYYFVIDGGILKVRNLKLGSRFSIHLDLKKEINRIQMQKISFKKDILCRALGYKGQENFRVIDGTLGLGKDAVHIISFGIHVLGFEINPFAFCFFEEALFRTSGSFNRAVKSHAPEEKTGYECEDGTVPSEFSIVLGKAFSSGCSLSRPSVDLKKFLKIKQMDVLQGVFLFSKGVDSLYLDPMFENIKNKSKPVKSMVFLRDISCEKDNVQGVITEALNRGIKRVVVKRPINGDYLYGRPDFSYRGKLVRYDVYSNI